MSLDTSLQVTPQQQQGGYAPVASNLGIPTYQLQEAAAAVPTDINSLSSAGASAETAAPPEKKSNTGLVAGAVALVAGVPLLAWATKGKLWGKVVENTGKEGDKVAEAAARNLGEALKLDKEHMKAFKRLVDGTARTGDDKKLAKLLVGDDASKDLIRDTQAEIQKVAGHAQTWYGTLSGLPEADQKKIVKALLGGEEGDGPLTELLQNIRKASSGEKADRVYKMDSGAVKNRVDELGSIEVVRHAKDQIAKLAGRNPDSLVVGTGSKSVDDHYNQLAAWVHELHASTHNPRLTVSDADAIDALTSATGKLGHRTIADARAAGLDAAAILQRIKDAHATLKSDAVRDGFVLPKN